MGRVIGPAPAVEAVPGAVAYGAGAFAAQPAHDRVGASEDALTSVAASHIVDLSNFRPVAGRLSVHGPTTGDSSGSIHSASLLGRTTACHCRQILHSALDRARRVEAAAQGRAQWLTAVTATRTLRMAANDAGWTGEQLAEASGLSLAAVRKKIQQTRRAGRRPGLEVTPAPPKHPPPPLPRDQRAWLRASEAEHVYGVSKQLIAAWRRAGLMPSTQRLDQARRLYAKSDLDRIVTAPRRGIRGGVSWRAVREQILEQAKPVAAVACLPRLLAASRERILE